MYITYMGKYVQLRNAKNIFLWLGGEPNHEDDDDENNQQCCHDIAKLFPFHHLQISLISWIAKQ